MAIAAAPIALPGSAELVTAQGDLWLCLFKLTFSGSYVALGDPLNFLTLWPGGQNPSAIVVVDIVGGAGNQFEYDLVNAKVRGYSAANTELTVAAYNAAITGDPNIIAQVYAK
jgi:hypothetical protein